MEVIIADTHNFGKAVSIQDGVVVKPRSIGLEWLFLSEESPVRKWLHQKNYPVEEKLAKLDFFQKPKFSPSLEKNKVSFLNVKKKDFKLKEKDFLGIGSLIALVQWFGIGDLHSENIIIGEREDGSFVCSPIDIECIFEEFKLPSQSLILPSYVLEKKHSGLKSVFSYMEENFNAEDISTIISSYIDTYLGLSDSRETIWDIIKLIFNEEEIMSRVILRETQQYYAHIEGHTKLELYKDEETQTDRSDIPYFFRFLNHKKLFFWVSDTEFRESTIALKDFDKLEQQIPILSDKFFQTRNETQELKYGILQLARSFDNTSLNHYNSSSFGVSIVYKDDHISVSSKIGNIKCARLS